MILGSIIHEPLHRELFDDKEMVHHSVSLLGAILQHNYSLLSLSGPGCSDSVLCSSHHHRTSPSTFDNSKGTLVHRAVLTSGARTQTAIDQSRDSCSAFIAASDQLFGFWLYRCLPTALVVSVGVFYLVHPICTGLCRVRSAFWLVQETVPRISQTMATTIPSILNISFDLLFCFCFDIASVC